MKNFLPPSILPSLLFLLSFGSSATYLLTVKNEYFLEKNIVKERLPTILKPTIYLENQPFPKFQYYF